MVENETLKKKVNELTRTLGKAYGGEDRLLMCLGSQRASLYKERLGYCNNPGFPITQKSELKNFSNKTHAW